MATILNKLFTTGCIVLALQLNTETIQAQVPLNVLLEKGLERYPAVDVGRYVYESSKHDVQSIKMEYVPRITGQHQYTYGTSNSLAGAFYPNPAVISPSGSIRPENIDLAAWGSYTSVLLEWDVFNFGKVSGRIKAAATASEAESANYSKVRLYHQVRIADAYLLGLMYEKLKLIQQLNLQRASVFNEIVEASVRAGMRAGVDSSLARTEQVKARLLLLQAEREHKSQLLQLQELTGEITETELKLDSAHFFREIPVLTDTSQRHLHPLLKYYQLRAKAAHQKSIATHRLFLPSITLVGAAWVRGSGISPVDDTYHAGFRYGTRYQVHNYLLGISTRWTFTDFFSVQQRYKSQQLQARANEAQLSEQELLIKRQLQEAEMQYNLNMEQVQAAPLQWRLAQDAYEQANARYKNGLTDLPTFMQALITLNRSEADMAIAYTNVWRSLLAIAAARGDFSIFMNAVQR